MASSDQGTGRWIEAESKIRDPSNYDSDGANFRDWRLPTLREFMLVSSQLLNLTESTIWHVGWDGGGVYDGYLVSDTPINDYGSNDYYNYPWEYSKVLFVRENGATYEWQSANHARYEKMIGEYPNPWFKALVGENHTDYHRFRAVRPF
jgi:hypothetical protein